MGAILYFLPYILVPLAFTLLFKGLKISTKHTWLTYCITTVIILFYPYVFFKIDDYLHPKPPDYHCVDCGMVVVSFFIGGLFIFLPISVGLQWLFNRILGINYLGKGNSEVMDTNK